MPARARSDSFCFSRPAQAIVMWNIGSPIGVVVSITAPEVGWTRGPAPPGSDPPAW
jgi:hypothetical protein